MKVLMLGWEYPPHITGGLGTACEGLTKALSRQNIAVDFIVPHLVGDEYAPHMQLLDSCSGLTSEGEPSSELFADSSAISEDVSVTKIPAYLAPYWNEETFQEHIRRLSRLSEDELLSLIPEELRGISENGVTLSSINTKGYSGDLLTEVQRFAANVVLVAKNRQFDVIHAHDWITFPAGVALSRLTGKPLVVHVHSLEVDRAGAGADNRVKSLERLGFDHANKIIAVSHYTSTLIQREHGVHAEKINVVHNGVYSKKVVSHYKCKKSVTGKTVLFLGRVTFQKGPDYFVETAAKVIPHVPDVHFVLAGIGDMLPRMIDRVGELGIAKHFHFTGFLKGREVEEMYSIADLYVMPSVSEPFGLTALEAVNFNVPVIISRQSGVSEVLSHALKVDFWDTQKSADMIINCLLYDELRHDMASMAHTELKQLRWDAAAVKTVGVYDSVLGSNYSLSA